jgi:3-deoxy-manno-octulosonate cytidylyltransferase (CMP-KDO synthetase)
MKALGIIPARYASTRFPGKPLAMIDGRSMIRRVYEQCVQCPDLSRVIVATDSREILHHVKNFGGETVLTSANHRSGTERCAEVLEKLGRGKGAVKPEAIINIQGDEPFIDPRQISQVVIAFRDPNTAIATLAKRITSPKEIRDPNVVKVVFSGNGAALYFSRSPIPFLRNHPVKEWLRQGIFYKHVGIYGYRPEVLGKLVTLPVSSLESAESLEQLRWLEAGFSITVRETEYETVAVDTPSDLLKITNIKSRKQR